MIARTALPDHILCAGIIKGGLIVMVVNESRVSEEETQEFRDWRRDNR